LPLVANYPKTSPYGLTLAKPLRQFHALQRNIRRLIKKTLVLVIEPKNKEYNFRTIRPNPALLARPQTLVLHQNLRQVSSSEIILTNILQPSEYVRSKAGVVIKKMALINSQRVSKKDGRTKLTS